MTDSTALLPVLALAVPALFTGRLKEGVLRLPTTSLEVGVTEEEVVAVVVLVLRVRLPAPTLTGGRTISGSSSSALV